MPTIEIPEIYIPEIYIPEPYTPDIPVVTQYLEINPPGCSYQHRDIKNTGNHNLLLDDPNGTYTICDFTFPKYIRHFSTTGLVIDSGPWPTPAIAIAISGEWPRECTCAQKLVPCIGAGANAQRQKFSAPLGNTVVLQDVKRTARD